MSMRVFVGVFWITFRSFFCFVVRRYENLKGKYFEIKRAQMNGEQRPYWLYYNEMDYIISHFPGHRPRINTLEATTNAATTSTSSTNSATLTTDTPANATNSTEFPDVKPLRTASGSIDTSEFLSSNLRFIHFKFV